MFYNGLEWLALALIVAAIFCGDYGDHDCGRVSGANSNRNNGCGCGNGYNRLG